jgi:hypothetical protein
MGQAGLVEDGFKSTPLQVAVVIRKRNLRFGLRGMLQNIVAASGMVNDESSPLQGAKHWTGLRGRKSGHAESRVTVISSLTGSAESLLSAGIGWPSLRRLPK